MKTKSKSLLVVIGLFLIAASLSCQIGGRQAEPVKTDVPVENVQATPIQGKTEPPAPTSALPAPTKIPTEAPPKPTSAPPPAAEEPVPCAEEVCIQEGTFLLQRPVGQGGRMTYDTSNRYGEYQRSTRNANLGSDFLNSTGAPVVAAADGKVIVAGDDSQTAYSQRLNEYGNLVILEHSFPGIPKPVYTLYAHLSEVLVKEGDSVSAGQEMGKVGMSGNVGGSTLHFEVRQGENKPENAVNPELWLAPMSDEDGKPLGALAGSIVDADGKFIELRNIVLERLAGAGQPALDQFYLKTYSDKDLTGRDPWRENFAAGDLPAGTYQISVWLGQMYQKIVEIEPGKLTVVNFQIK
jgi:murein DD-endopeptidase MepM/ murein hydrolase activator NlpD